MKSFMIYPDKARALGNVMNNNSNVLDMVEVNSNVIALMDTGHPVTLEDGNQYVPPCTVDYDNLSFPIFQMSVLGSLYATSLTVNVSTNNCYIGDIVTITATLRDNNDELLDGLIAFKCGNDYITNGNNTGTTEAYANTTNGVVSFTYAFNSMGEYIIRADSLETNTHHSATGVSGTIVVSKKPTSFNISGINDSTTYSQDIPFTVQLRNNNQTVSGLSYSITLDGEEFDSGVSTSNGESYTINNLEAGLHTISFYFGGNTMYDSCSETIEFHNGKVPDYMTSELENVSVNPQAHTLSGDMTIAIYSETLPVENMPVDITISPAGIHRTGLVTDSNGEVTFSFTGINYTVDNTITVVTADYGDFKATTLTTQIDGI